MYLKVVQKNFKVVLIAVRIGKTKICIKKLSKIDLYHPVAHIQQNLSKCEKIPIFKIFKIAS